MVENQAAHAMEMKMEEKAKAKAKEEVMKKAKEEKKEKEVAKASKGFALELEDFGYLKFPLMTEKAINLIEKENRLSFIATEKATKSNVKNLIEKLYKVKVEKVNVLNDMKGRKKVSVKLSKKYKAEELAAKLGVI